MIKAAFQIIAIMFFILACSSVAIFLILDPIARLLSAAALMFCLIMGFFTYGGILFIDWIGGDS